MGDAFSPLTSAVLTQSLLGLILHISLYSRDMFLSVIGTVLVSDTLPRIISLSLPISSGEIVSQKTSRKLTEESGSPCSRDIPDFSVNYRNCPGLRHLYNISISPYLLWRDSFLKSLSKIYRRKMLSIRLDTDPRYPGRYPNRASFYTILEASRATGIPPNSLRWQCSTGKPLTRRSTGHTYEIKWKDIKVKSKCKDCDKWLMPYEVSRWFNVCNDEDFSRISHNFKAASHATNSFYSTWENTAIMEKRTITRRVDKKILIIGWSPVCASCREYNRQCHGARRHK